MVGLRTRTENLGDGNAAQQVRAQEEWRRHNEMVEAVRSRSNSSDSSFSVPSSSITNSPLANVIGVGCVALVILWLLAPIVAGGGTGWFVYKKTAGKGLKVRLAATLLAGLGAFGGTNALVGNPYFGGSSEPATQEYVQPAE